MRIAVIAETDPHEGRVAVTPETAKKLVALGADIRVQKGAGLASGMLDADYEAAGAAIAATAKEALAEADLVLKVRRPTPAELKLIPKGAMVIGLMDPYGHADALNAMAAAGIASFAMEFMPRITRAQVMDVLSSQANLAGYRAVVDAAAEYGRALPMMMTAAGTVPAARIFIMGVGVAGLQAIATARRLGAVVTATDVRPATKEQVLNRLGRNSSRSRMTSSSRPRRLAAMPRKCRKTIRPSRQILSPPISPNRISSSPPR
jgi:H+-translocating NAD(P) transhydrogenase subunit alpha